MTPSWFWIVFTIFAAAGQTARNTMQRKLTAELGATGATQVRFLFGFPFALLFLTGLVVLAHQALPHPAAIFWFSDFTGAITQILGTALMLLLMEERSFVVATAYIKTEPVFVAIFGLVIMGDLLTPAMTIAIAICVVGVIVLSVDPKRGVGSPREAMLGIASGAFFGMSAIGFRGAILSLHNPNYVMAATFTLTLGLLMQSVVLTFWLAIRSPRVLRGLARLWRPSLLAGLMGSAASEMWFLAFALTSAANVRTLGLIDVAFAQAVSRFVFGHRTTRREYAGIALLLAGAILLVVVHR